MKCIYCSKLKRFFIVVVLLRPVLKYFAGISHETLSQMFRTASIIINDYQRSSKLKLALACDIQTRYPSRLWILLSLAELNLFLKEMTAYGLWPTMHSDFRVIVHSGHVSSLAMKARHKAFARCNKKFWGENIRFPVFSSIFCLGDGWFTLTVVLNVLVYFPSFLFLD